MMKSILTFADADPRAAQRLTVASDLARAYGGHVTIAALGYEPDMPAYSFPDVAADAMMELYRAAQSEAVAAEAAAKEAMTRAGVLHDVRPIVSAPSLLASRFGALARYADLVVLDPPYDDDAPTGWSELLEGALFDGDAAVLVRPSGASAPRLDKIVVAWNESREALRAARAAQPLLAQARSVEIAVVDPDRDEQEMCADLAVMLSRRGAEVSVASIARAGRSVSAALRQHAIDVAADLLVMGAYGHSRFREYVLGGPTREILLSPPTATLMAH